MKNGHNTRHFIALRKLLQQAVKEVNARGGGIYLFDHKSETQFLIVHVNRPEKYCAPLKKGEGLSWHLFEQKLDHLIVGDYAHSPNPAKAFVGGDFKSMVLMALTDGEKFLGTIFVEDPKREFFSEADVAILKALTPKVTCKLLKLRPQSLRPVSSYSDSELVTNAPIAIIVAEKGIVLEFNWQAGKIIPKIHTPFISKIPKP